jgi:hypothetical protein
VRFPAECRARRVSGRVEDADVRVVDRRNATRASAQAEVEILPVEVDGRVEGPELAQQVGPRGEAGRDRPPDGARAIGAVGLDAVAQRARQQRRMDQRGQVGTGRRGQRMGAALDGAVRIEQARSVQRGRMAARERRQAGEAVVEELAIRVEQDGDGSATCSSAALLAAPKPGLSRRTSTVAPAPEASAAPPSSGPVSTTTSGGRAGSARGRRGAARGRAGSGAGRRRRRSSRQVLDDRGEPGGAGTHVEVRLRMRASGGGRAGIGERRADRAGRGAGIRPGG